MVVSADRLASEAGLEILKKGGSAVDAAVAVGFVLAVVFPEAGNIGGGGFMLIRKKGGEAVVIDFREKAPGASQRTMYIDSAGNVTDKTLIGQLAAGVPGTVAGLLKALHDFGTMSPRDVLRPAIDLARNGFVVDRRLERSLESCKTDMSGFQATMSVFTRNGVLLKEGDTLRQPDLTATLSRIQERGTEGFYKGETARLILEEMRRGGGIMTQKDLEDYQAIVREPVKGSYRGYEILSAPLPSSGGLCVLEILNIMEGYDLASMGWHSSLSVHLMAESMRRVYADRAEFMGDPRYVDAPVRALISKPYAGERRREIDPSRAAESASVRHGSPQGNEGRHTTHYCTVDESGTIVSTTYTLNDLFGCKALVGGAGFLLNDEMDDFSAKPGVPNAYGLIGGDANAIAPGKRPLSSMTPTIVLKDSRPFLALGARGGSKIITAVVQAISNVIDFGMGPQEAVDAPRFHHQWMPDTLVYEKFCFPRDVIQNLEQKGHRLWESDGPLGELEAIAFDTAQGWMYGAPDSREGGVAVGY